MGDLSEEHELERLHRQECYEEQAGLHFLEWRDQIRILRSEAQNWHRMAVATLNSSTSSPAEQLIAGMAILCGSIGRNSTSSSVTEVCINHMRRLLEDVEKKLDYSIHDIILVLFAKFMLSFFSVCAFETAPNLESRLAVIRTNTETMEYAKLVTFMCSARKGADYQLLHRITGCLFDCAQWTWLDQKRFSRTRTSLRCIIGVLENHAAELAEHPTTCAFARLFIVAADVALMDSPPVKTNRSTADSEQPDESSSLREEERYFLSLEVKEETDDSLLASTVTASPSSEIKMEADQVKLEPGCETCTPENFFTGSLFQGDQVFVGEPQDNYGVDLVSKDVTERETSSSSSFMASTTFTNDSLDMEEEEEEEEEDESERGEGNGIASCSFETTEEPDENKEVPLLASGMTSMGTSKQPASTARPCSRAVRMRGMRVARLHALLARDGISIDSKGVATTSVASLPDVSTGTLIALFSICPSARDMALKILALIGEHEPSERDLTRVTSRLIRVARKAMTQEREIVREGEKMKHARDPFYASRVDVRAIVKAPYQKQVPKRDRCLISHSIDTSKKKSSSNLFVQSRALSQLCKDEHSYSRIEPK